MSAEATPLQSVCTDLPADFCAVIHQAIEKKPENRFQTAEAMMDALAPWDGLLREASSLPPLRPSAPAPDAGPDHGSVAPGTDHGHRSQEPPAVSERPPERLGATRSERPSQVPQVQISERTTAALASQRPSHPLDAAGEDAPAPDVPAPPSPSPRRRGTGLSALAWIGILTMGLLGSGATAWVVASQLQGPAGSPEDPMAEAGRQTARESKGLPAIERSREQRSEEAPTVPPTHPTLPNEADPATEPASAEAGPPEERPTAHRGRSETQVVDTTVAAKTTRSLAIRPETVSTSFVRIREGQLRRRDVERWLNTRHFAWSECFAGRGEAVHMQTVDAQVLRSGHVKTLERASQHMRCLRRALPGPTIRGGGPGRFSFTLHYQPVAVRR